LGDTPLQNAAVASAQVTPGRIRVFISYAWADCAPLAQLLYDTLRQSCEPWKDDHRMGAGATWTSDIERAIDATDVLVALVSPGSIQSDICRCERIRAFRKKKTLIPVLAVLGTDMPLELEGRIWRDLSDVKHYQAQVDLLLNDILHGHAEGTIPDRFRRTYVTAPALPGQYVARPDALTALRASLITDATRPGVGLSALQGMGGIGKTVLALAITHDDVVQQAFPDGIIWVPIGREPAYDLTSRLREVGKALGDSPLSYGDELAAKNALKTVMREKAVLIVLDDVWSVRDVAPFLVDSPNSRLLFTTRDASIAATLRAVTITADFLSTADAREMMAMYVGLTAESLPTVADSLVMECGGLPLAVAAIGAMLAVHRDDPKAWLRIQKLLAAADLEKIARDFPDYPYPSLLRALQVSVDALDPVTRERFLALAILSEGATILPIVQEILWNADEDDALGTAQTLVERALAQRADSNGALRLHDLLVDYLRAQYPDPKALRYVAEAMRLSWHVIARDPAQLPSQLIGRLTNFKDLPAIKSLLDRLSAWQGAPWLRPRTASLIPPGTTLITTLDEPRGGICSVAVADDGRTLAFVIADARNKIAPAVRIWRSREGVSTLSIEREVSAVALSPDATRLALAMADPALGILIWSLAEGAERQIQAIPALSGPAVKLVFAGNSRLTIVRQAGVEFWDLAPETPQLIRSVAFATGPADGSQFALADKAGRLFSITSTTFQSSLFEWSFEGDSAVPRAMPIPGGRRSFFGGRVAATPDAGTVVVGDLGIVILRRGGDAYLQSETLPGHGFVLVDLAIAPTADALASATYNQIRIWQLASGRPNPKSTRADDYIERLTMRSDGQFALGKYMNGGWLAIDIAAAQEMMNAALPAAAHLLTANYDAPHLMMSRGSDVLSVDASSGAVGGVRTSPVAGVVVAITPDSTRALSVAADPKNSADPAGSLATLWDTATGAVLAIWALPKDATCFTMFPDGSHLAVASGYEVLIFDLATGARRRTLVGPNGFVDCVAVAQTPAGVRVVAGSRDKLVHVWDPGNAQPMLVLTAHSYTISDVQFLPGGIQIMSCGGDNTLRVWNLSDGRCTTVFTADAWMLCSLPTPAGEGVIAADMSGRLHYLDFCGMASGAAA
jgi:WD40 repeat protein